MIAVILNPASGGGKTLRLLPKVSAALQSMGRPHAMHVTTGPNEAPEVAKRFALDGAEVIVAVGGDGTINEVANGIFASGKQIPIGLVPSGRGSDLVRTTGAPRQLEQALQLCCNGQVRMIDVGRAHFSDGASRIFLNAGGIGFDAAVAERVHGAKLPGSTLPYLWGLVGALARYRNIHVSIDADGRLMTTTARSVLVANARYLGGGMLMHPMADIADGFLDVAILGDLGRAEIVRAVPSVYRGKHVTHPKFTHLRAKTIRVESVEPARVQLDGELAGYAPVTFTVEPASLFLAG
ncbi:MAG: diacylglycerol/lipid kinase family protein [Thermomicrobiales bacterium]